MERRPRAVSSEATPFSTWVQNRGSQFDRLIRKIERQNRGAEFTRLILKI